MILNLGSGRYPLTRAINLDRLNGWEAPELPFKDGSIEAVTISHFLMYLDDWAEMLNEIHRVVELNGFVRITEDDCTDPANVWRDAVYRATPGDTIRWLHATGFELAQEVKPRQTAWPDDTLIQQWHGAPPKVFHVEAIRGLR